MVLDEDGRMYVVVVAAAVFVKGHIPIVSFINHTCSEVTGDRGFKG